VDGGVGHDCEGLSPEMAAARKLDIAVLPPIPAADDDLA
jgi:hypothetical protein